MKLRKIYLTQSRKDAKETTNIMIYLGALASLRENKQFLSSIRLAVFLASGGWRLIREAYVRKPART